MVFFNRVVLIGDILNIVSKFGNTFDFGGVKLKYFLNWYNKTWRNERCIEIPIVRYLQKDIQGNTLEIGNVIQHYFSRPEDLDIVDKYEKAPFVMNVDITKFVPAEKYKKIIAVSTLEHCGEDSADPQQGIIAINRLKTFLAPGGTMIFTIPAGWNKVLDVALPELGLVLYGFKKTETGLWMQCDPYELIGMEYDRKNNSANGLFVCTFRKSATK